MSAFLLQLRWTGRFGNRLVQDAYGADGKEEIDVDFVEGNHPHWLHGEEHAHPDTVLGA